MKIQVFKQREDGTIDFAESVVVEQGEIPQGYVQITEHGVYSDKGNRLSPEELEFIRNKPRPKSETQLLGEQLVQKDLEFISLQSDNKQLGQQVVMMDLRLMQGGM